MSLEANIISLVNANSYVSSTYVFSTVGTILFERELSVVAIEELLRLSLGAAKVPILLHRRNGTFQSHVCQ